nr:hypothetical protein [Angustibacter aerolatus]
MAGHSLGGMAVLAWAGGHLAAVADRLRGVALVSTAAERPGYAYPRAEPAARGAVRAHPRPAGRPVLRRRPPAVAGLHPRHRPRDGAGGASARRVERGVDVRAVPPRDAPPRRGRRAAGAARRAGRRAGRRGSTG